MKVLKAFMVRPRPSHCRRYRSGGVLPDSVATTGIKGPPCFSPRNRITVTQYYARPTATQVLNAAEMMFVDRIDVAAEALRSPEEIGRMLKEAEGKVGALTEVFGGTCVVANMCPAKFACVGCAGNAPDPGKRYQIEQKKAWAEQQLRYAIREKLAGEERTLKQLIADCKLVMQEMDLIEAARSDQAQAVSVHHGATKG